MKTEQKLSYSENHVIFSSKWTVEDLKEAIRYSMNEDQKNVDLDLVITDEQVEELGNDVCEAVEQAIENFMNSYF